MPRDPELIDKRNNAIRQEFEKLTSIREYGVRKYHHEYCLARLANTYFLARHTVERIIYSRD